MEFPTHVGMNRDRLYIYNKSPRVPHTRGDEPAAADLATHGGGSSPHTWG